MAKKKGRRILRFLLINVPLAFLLITVSDVLIHKWLPVRVTPLMVKRMVEFKDEDTFNTQKKWVSIDEISPAMMKAVIASEDNRFEEHNGFDFKELKKMAKDHAEKGKKIRGCSTISQQTAKNCFTWCGDNLFRKISEAYWTWLIESIWGKERIMEVYLNVIEMGKGIYGVEAAAQAYFKEPASKLTLQQSALIAASLPDPLHRSVTKPSAYMKKRQKDIVSLTSKLRYPDWIKK